LDKDTEGLLLLTNDGEFSHRLMYPDKHVDKTYFFWVFGTLDAIAVERLKAGVRIGEDDCLAKAVQIELVERGLFSDLKDKMNLEEIREIRINPFEQSVAAGYLTISEGRKHQVKRMLKSVGCFVVYLKRVSIGGLKLDETLEKGQYRELTSEEISII
jgi:16S rRNA pseudouridine516 synthase